MSATHLTIGSKEPPRVEGLLRLYSMAYCPYAQRPRLILKAKGIPHDIVNIDLSKKPEWYFKIHPEGKVPALFDGSKIVLESLDISDYLDEKYPENPLYPADPEAKKQDKELIQKIGSVTGLFGNVFKDGITVEGFLNEFLGPLQVFEDALAKRGTTFFGGEKPGMLDYMFWPWAERADVVPIKFGKKLPIQKSQIPHLRKWKKAMRDDPVCSELYIPPEAHWKLVESRIKGTAPDYDSYLLKQTA